MISLIFSLSSLFLNYTITSIYGSDINDSSEIVGIIKDASFIVAETNETKKLTSVGIVEARTPESGVINLMQYEGKAILVFSQQVDDEWIWGTTIIDIADPLVTKLVKETYNLH